MNRQKALESFVNDKVVQKAVGLFVWRDKYYEVLPYSILLKRHNWSQFIRHGKYYIREASKEIVKKYYETKI